MQVYDEANTLARAIRESDVCQDYRRLKEAVDSDETSRALVKEYKLLFAQESTAQMLLSEMRVQQMMADVYKILGDAAGIELPGM